LSSGTRREKESSSGRDKDGNNVNTATRNANARISFFDPANQGMIDRLLAGTGWADESPEVIMANVEEMLEGYEWVGESTLVSGSGATGKRRRGTGDQIEAALHGELMALEKVSKRRGSLWV
jgi:hypothetical protein